MRKNLLASITGPETPKVGQDARSVYAARGASRSMMLSIDEMAENAKKMIAGEAIVELNPALIDGSFVSDRLGDDEDYAELRDAIQQRGQMTPILVRPHPGADGRYMIVFGHRRVRVARELAISVKAVIKEIEDIAHIVAQGQENTARANLSFIEKALFAKKLLAMGQTKETIKSAMTIDDTLLSRMLSVAETVPLSVIEAIGAAKFVGRDRWEELKKLVMRPAIAEHARGIVRSGEFKAKEPGERFNFLLAQLRSGRRPFRGDPQAATSWTPDDKRVKATYRNTGKAFNLSLTSMDASEFGQYISTNLQGLYRAFRDAKNQEGGG